MAATYKAWVLKEEGNLESLELINVPFQDPLTDEVLVKNECSTINSGDVESCHGLYESPPAPRIVGLKGSGIVVKSGGGNLADSLINKRVAFATFGTWSEFSIVKANRVYPLLDSTSFEQGTTICYNPLTVLNITEFIQSGGHSAVIQNAAASSLGKQLLRYCNKLGIPIINIVRREEQVSVLHELGAQHVFNSSSSNWLKQAKLLAGSLKASVGIDSVGGQGTDDLLELLQDRGVVYSIGCTSGLKLQASSSHFVFHLKSVRGLNVIDWFHQKNDEERTAKLKFIQENFHIFDTCFSHHVELEGVKDALLDYSNCATNNKYLIRTKIE